MRARPKIALPGWALGAFGPDAKSRRTRPMSSSSISAATSSSVSPTVVRELSGSEVELWKYYAHKFGKT